MSQTPILLVIFNRPDVTQKVLDRIREVKPAKLYIAADGPRPGREGEEELCKQTRQVAEQVDWTCEVKKLYRDRNLGCGKAVSGAVSWFFEQEEQGIILEDDIMPDLSFFEYCARLLRDYRSDASVMHINGCNFQEGRERGDGSYYFSAFPHVWGWAGWRRSWKHYDFNLSDLNYFYNLKKINRYFPEKNIQNKWLEIFFRMNRKQIDTWDYQWNYAIWNAGGKVITPNVNLISNIGFGAGATHTTETESKFANMKTGSLHDLVRPTGTAIDHRADLQTFSYCY